MAKKFTEVSQDTVLQYFARMGFVPPPHPDDAGVLGGFLASRPEVKLAVTSPGEPIGVSDTLPEVSRSFLVAFARHLGKAQVVADAAGVHVFTPGGQVVDLPK